MTDVFLRPIKSCNLNRKSDIKVKSVSRRVYVKGKKTYAKGQAPDLSKSNRYQNIISLMSIRVEDVHERNPMDRTGEFYFEVGGKGLFKHDA